jgi:hypothetical protein
VVSLAVSNGGATSPSVAFANTWVNFSAYGTAPANVATWSGTYLSYYPQGLGFDSCATDPVRLLTTYSQNGQCGSFAYLLQAALYMNGMDSIFTRVAAVNNDAFLVKNWSRPDSPTATDTPPYYWTLPLQTELNGGLGMVPLQPLGLYGDMTSLSGLPGQGELFLQPQNTPSEKWFGSHYIVKLVDPTLAPADQPGPYFDASYGVWYTDAASFESKAVAGYARQVRPENSNNWRFKDKIPGSINIAFDH